MKQHRWSAWALAFASFLGCGAGGGPSTTVPVAVSSSAPELGDRVGSADFPTSCAAAERVEMNRSVALLHSFFYEEARRRFREIGKRDPTCAMAEWGVAMTLWHPIWQAPRPEEFAEGLDAVKKARAIGPKSARELAYVEAIEAFYTAPAGSGEPATQSCHGVVTSDRKRGAAAYEAKMADLVQRFPDDLEAKVFHALALLATHPPTDTTLAKPLRAASILEGLSPAHPEHPGIAHYLIHSYDYPPLASKGLPAARAYASMAPWVPHALHMPSHIFTRLGMWPDSIASNLAAAEAARKYEARFHPGENAAEEVHALDYLVYAYLQAGQDTKAGEIVRYLGSIERTKPSMDLVSAYPFGTIPARFALERRKWADAASLTAPPLAKNLAFAEAHIELARGLGAARTGDAKRARASIARLAELGGAIKDPAFAFFVKQVEIQRAAVEAWTLEIEGAHEGARAKMRAAADQEDLLGKHPVTPGAVVPVRELLGELLLAQDQAPAALEAFETSLTAAPNRFLGLYGAARAADRAGDRVKARAYYEKLVTVAGGGDARPEIDEARGWLAKK